MNSPATYQEQSPEIQNHFCVLVLDLVGSTELVHQLTLPAWRDLLTEWGTHTVGILEKWGAWVLPLQGDAAIACWPDWQIEAALGAAHAAHQAARNVTAPNVLNRPLTLRAGLAVGELAMLHQPLPFPCGIPFHLAQRLSSVAEPGETLLCPTAAQTLEVHPGVEGSVLSRRVMPALRGFESLQSTGADFYSLTAPFSIGSGTEMKAG